MKTGLCWGFTCINGLRRFSLVYIFLNSKYSETQLNYSNSEKHKINFHFLDCVVFSPVHLNCIHTQFGPIALSTLKSKIYVLSKTHLKKKSAFDDNHKC